MSIYVVDIFAFVCILFIIGYSLYIIYYAIGLYELNPFAKQQKLTHRDIGFLQQNIPQIQKLSQSEKEKLFVRTAWFKSKKPFVYKGQVSSKNEVELLISASGMLLTLGMKSYKFIRAVHRVIVYPSDYYSILNKKHHVGEYNVGLKTLVFSEKGLRDGFEDDRDNINLAIHEFAHALCIETSGKNSWEARRFQFGLKKVKELFENQSFQEQYDESGYFRGYGLTSLIEFFAVAAENFLETPEQFENLYPELYDLLKKMLNYSYT